MTEVGVSRLSRIVNAVTKLHLPEESLRAMTKRAVGHDFSSFSCEELAGGLCNAVYLIETEDGKIVERGFRHYEDPNTYAWVLDEYSKEIRALRNALGA